MEFTDFGIKFDSLQEVKDYYIKHTPKVAISERQWNNAEEIITKASAFPMIEISDYDDDEFPPVIQLSWNTMKEYIGSSSEGNFLSFLIGDWGDDILVDYALASYGVVGGEVDTVEDAINLYKMYDKQFLLSNGHLYDEFMTKEELSFFDGISNMFDAETEWAKYIYSCVDEKPDEIFVESKFNHNYESKYAKIFFSWILPNDEKITVSYSGIKHISCGLGSWGHDTVYVSFEFSEYDSLLTDLLENTQPYWSDIDYFDFLVDDIYTVDFVSFFKERIEPYVKKHRQIQKDVCDLVDYCNDCETETPDEEDLVNIYWKLDKLPDEAYPEDFRRLQMVWNNDEEHVYASYYPQYIWNNTEEEKEHFDICLYKNKQEQLNMSCSVRELPSVINKLLNNNSRRD